MNLDDAISQSMLAQELGISAPTAAAILKEAGGGVKFGSMTVYARESVAAVLAERHRRVLGFITEYLKSEGGNEAAV